LINGRGSSPFMMETLMWSVKESVFKWHGNGGVDFREHIHIQAFGSLSMQELLKISFTGEPLADLDVFYHLFGEVCLSWVSSDHTG
jgi:phosphopantetheinyl transferase